MNHKLPSFSPQEALFQDAKNFLKKLKEAEKVHLNNKTPVEVLIKHRSQETDNILKTIFTNFLNQDDYALLAIGGYGRGELFPRSDIDLLILIKENARQALEKLLPELWGIGLDIAHSVRTVEECLNDLKTDYNLTTALLEKRFITGNKALSTQINIEKKPPFDAETFFHIKLEEQKARDQKQLQVGKLEPNIKTDHGGLRDIHMIEWIIRYCFPQQNLKSLLSQQEYQTLEESRQTLWQIRFALHLLNTPHKDRLSFEAQQKLSQNFGFQSGNKGQDIEQFMRLYYLSTLQIRRLNRLAIKLLDEALHTPLKTLPLDKNFQLINNRLALKKKDALKENPALLWEIFLTMLENPQIDSLSPSLARTLRDNHSQFSAKALNDKAHQNILKILNHKGDIYRQLRRMHRYNLISLYLPEFTKITGQMQYDLFHEYTVDYHTLRLIYFLDHFKQNDDPNYPESHQLFQKLKKPALLYLSALLHDIGKGQNGDHSEIGAKIAKKHNNKNPHLTEEDRDLVEFLIRHHLDLSRTAQKKDLDNPETIAQFAALFPKPEYLDYLYLLTLADISATNSNLWNSWRKSLMHTLYSACQTYWQKGAIHNHKQETLANFQDKKRIIELWQNLPESFFNHESTHTLTLKTQALLKENQEQCLLLEQNPARFIILSKHSPDIIFARTTHFLEKNTLNIAEAKLYPREKQNIQEYTLTHSLPHKNFLNALQQAINDPQPLTPPPPRLQINHPLKHFNTNIKIRTQNHKEYSALELQCKDRHGLLSLISRILLAHNIHLAHAKIATFGERVEDNFYLTDQEKRPLDDSTLKKLKKTIQEALET